MYVLFWLLGYEIAVNQWIITQWPNQRSVEVGSLFAFPAHTQGILAVKAQMSSRSGWHFYEDWWVPSMGYVRNLNVFWLTVACIQMACFSLSRSPSFLFHSLSIYPSLFPYIYQSCTNFESEAMRVCVFLYLYSSISHFHRKLMLLIFVFWVERKRLSLVYKNASFLPFSLSPSF